MARISDIVAGATDVDVKTVARRHGGEVAKSHLCLSCEGVKSELNLLGEEYE